MTQELTGRKQRRAAANESAAATASGSAATASAAAASAAETESAPASPEPRPRRFGVLAWLRWGWRQLTSMRTALVLLFLLALASIPGSVLPQQGIDPAAVSQYYAAHPALAPFLARLSGFDVFGAPWFAAIYLLLFASLAGCVLPRTYRMARSARQPPPKAPRHLGRLPQAAGFLTGGTPRPGARLGRGAAPPAPLQDPHRRRLGVGGEGLPARGRQPAVPRGAARPARLRGARRAVRVQGQQAAGRGRDVRQHPGRP